MVSSPPPLIIFIFPVILALLSSSSASASSASASAPAAASTCSDEFLSMLKTNRDNVNCRRLTTLEAEFGWVIRDPRMMNKSGGAAVVDVFFGATLDDEEGWLAWGVNPSDRPQMIGTRAMIGIKHWNRSFEVNTYNITADTKRGCQLRPSKFDDGDVSFTNMSIDNRTDGFVVISATLTLPYPEYNISKLHHVWQVGDEVEGNEPKQHPTRLQNVDSTEMLNMWNGECRGVGQHRRHLRTVHGILNILGWGTLLPLGVIVARYFREFPFKRKPWFVAHVSIQIIGYTLGTIGWAIGLGLGHSSRYYTFRIHRILAIFIFTFTTLQMLALRLKPDSKDEYRKYWDMYHHFLGYALLALISVNIFQGIAILKPDHTWKWAYIALLGVLASITILFELCTWVKFIRLRQKLKKDAADKGLKATPATQGGGGGPPVVGGGGGGGPPGVGGGGGGGPPGVHGEEATGGPPGVRGNQGEAIPISKGYLAEDQHNISCRISLS